MTAHIYAALRVVEMDGARTFRSSFNFLMAIAATGSIAYIGLDSVRPDLMQKISQAPLPASARANAPDNAQGWKLGSFIEKFLESDRAYLQERGSWGGISFRANDRDTAAVKNRQAAAPGIREQFGRVIADQQAQGTSGLALFLPMNAASPKPAKPVAERQSAARTAGALTAEPETQARPSRAGASPDPAPGRKPPAAKTGFQEVVPQTPASRQALPSQPAARALPARQALPTAPIGPAVPALAQSNDSREDDADVVANLMNQARRDIRMAPYAFAAARAYRARYPRDSRAPAFMSRMGDLQAALFDAIRERQDIGHTTILTEVQFGEEAREELAMCLQASGKLERVVIAAREVRHQSETPAFMVSLRARQNGASAPFTADDIVDSAGPCLIPLFRRGSVSLFHASDEDSALAVKRLEALTDAIIYDLAARLTNPAPANGAAPENKG